MGHPRGLRGRPARRHAWPVVFGRVLRATRHANSPALRDRPRRTGYGVGLPVRPSAPAIARDRSALGRDWADGDRWRRRKAPGVLFSKLEKRDGWVAFDWIRPFRWIRPHGSNELGAAEPAACQPRRTRTRPFAAFRNAPPRRLLVRGP